MLFPLSKRTKDSNGPRDLRHPEHGAGSFGTSQEALSMGNGNPNKEKQWRAAWSGGIEHRLKLEGLGSNLCFASFYLGNMRQVACLSFPWQCPHLWTLCPLAWPGLAWPGRPSLLQDGIVVGVRIHTTDAEAKETQVLATKPLLCVGHFIYVIWLYLHKSNSVSSSYALVPDEKTIALWGPCLKFHHQ